MHLIKTRLTQNISNALRGSPLSLPVPTVHHAEFHPPCRTQLFSRSKGGRARARASFLRVFSAWEKSSVQTNLAVHNAERGNCYCPRRRTRPASRRSAHFANAIARVFPKLRENRACTGGGRCNFAIFMAHQKQCGGGGWHCWWWLNTRNYLSLVARNAGDLWLGINICRINHISCVLTRFAH